MVTVWYGNKRATARKNDNFGWKAVVVYDDGRTYVPVRKNFATRDDAVTYAQRWVDANNNPGSDPTPQVKDRTVW